MTPSKHISNFWLGALVLGVFALAAQQVSAKEVPNPKDAPDSKEVQAPAPQPLGNLTKEEPDEKFVHLQEAKTKVKKLKEKGEIAQAVKAQRETLKIAQEEFGGNKLIMIEEKLILADLLQQQKEAKEADELLTEIGTLMDDCSECPAPFLEGLRKRVDDLRGGGEPSAGEK